MNLPYIPNINGYWQEPKKSPLPPPRFILAVLAALIIFMLIFVIRARAEEYTDAQIVSAIYHAEGGMKAQFAYGIRSIPYRTITEARQYCFNTVRNNRKRYARYGYKTHKTYLSFLASKYCPVSAHPLNRHWLHNVRYYLRRNANK